MQLGLILCSTTAMNQSPNDSKFVLSYKGGEDYDVVLIRLSDIREILQRIAREGKVRDTHGELPPGVGTHVAFALGGDKPWILTVLGRRNMNHTHFSASCRCTRENISCLDCEGGQDDHYACDADQMCRDSHVCPNMWIRGGVFVPFKCRCCQKEFTCLSEVEAEEELVLGMTVQRFKAWGETFSHEHDGRHWNSGPLLPLSWIWCDPLHLFLNLFNVAFDEAVDFFLQHEHVSSDSKALIAECDGVSRQVNQVLAAGHITARFGTDERKAFCGNDLRALMQHTSVLPDILSLVRPLYRRMEPCSFAADAAKARKEQTKAEERMAKEHEAAAPAKRGKRVDTDDFDCTAGISAAVARRLRKHNAAVKTVREKSMTFEQRFEAHVQAMEQAVEGNYCWRVVNMLNALVEFYEFVHAKEWLADAIDADAGEREGGDRVVIVGPAVTNAVRIRKAQCIRSDPCFLPKTSLGQSVLPVSRRTCTISCTVCTGYLMSCSTRC